MGREHTQKHISNHCPQQQKKIMKPPLIGTYSTFCCCVFFLCVCPVCLIYVLQGTYNSQPYWICLISKAPSGGISKIFRASKTSCGRLGDLTIRNVRNLGPCQKYGFHSQHHSAPYAPNPFCNLGGLNTEPHKVFGVLGKANQWIFISPEKKAFANFFGGTVRYVVGGVVGWPAMKNKNRHQLLKFHMESFDDPCSGGLNLHQIVCQNKISVLHNWVMFHRATLMRIKSMFSFCTDITSTISETDLNTLGACPRKAPSLILHHLSNAMENIFKTC